MHILWALCGYGSKDIIADQIDLYGHSAPYGAYA